MAEHFTIAILGAGNIGGTLGRAWSAAGHRVVFGVRSPQSQKNQALQTSSGGRLQVRSVSEALAGNSDVIVLALPGSAMDDVITTYAAQLDGHVLIDAANRPGGGPMHSLATFQTQTPHAQVYRAFNTLGWENFAHPSFGGIQADLFYCGPDGVSRPRVELLISDVGLRPVYLGGNERIDLVDSVTALWSALAFGQHRGRHLAFKVLAD